MFEGVRKPETECSDIVGMIKGLHSDERTRHSEAETKEPAQYPDMYMCALQMPRDTAMIGADSDRREWPKESRRKFPRCGKCPLTTEGRDCEYFKREIQRWLDGKG